MDKPEYDMKRIRKYLRGELPAREMYDLERQAQDDPFLMDLMEGMELAGDDAVHQANLDEIQHHVQGQVERKATVRSFASAWRKWAVAASVVLVGGIGALLIWSPPSVLRVPSAPEEAVAIVSNLGVQEEEVTPEIVLAEPSVPQADAVKLTSAERSVARSQELAGGISKDKLAAITKPAPQPARFQSDTMMVGEPFARLASSVSRADTASGGTAMMVASRLEPGVGQGKRLAISIRSLSEEALALREISGVVKDKESGNPLSGAYIYGLTSHLTAQSGEDGNFTLRLPIEDDNLRVVSSGFEPQTIGVGGRDSLVVVLEQSAGEQNELAAMGWVDRGYPDLGYENLRDTSAAKPRPATGWAAFDQYVAKETDASQGKGTVTLKFQIDSSGRTFNPQLEHTTNPALVKKAMDILLNGPLWELGYDQSRVATVLIEFR